ncbi:MAG: hypothetical protein DME19_13470, partial [Verrucomicrobia bacterium]
MRRAHRRLRHPQLFANGRQECARIGFSTDHNKRRVAYQLKFVARPIEGRSGRPGRRTAITKFADVANDSDDFILRRAAQAFPAELLPQGLFTRPERARHRLIDNRRADFFAEIVLVEVSARPQRNAHRPKEVALLHA